MTLLISSHTLNLVFLPKSFRGGVPVAPPVKRPRGGSVPTGPPDPFAVVYIALIESVE